jgi:hypothetical protein
MYVIYNTSGAKQNVVCKKYSPAFSEMQTRLLQMLATSAGGEIGALRRGSHRAASRGEKPLRARRRPPRIHRAFLRRFKFTAQIRVRPAARSAATASHSSGGGCLR